MEYFHGLVTAALGCFLIFYSMATVAITTVLLGWALIFVGLAQFVFALYSQTIGNFFLKVLLSLVYGICGIALAFLPIAGVAALTGVLGTILLIQAGLLTATAFQLRPVDGWGWFLFDAATNLLLGILILAKWPSSSVLAIGTLVGVSVLMRFSEECSRVSLQPRLRDGGRSHMRTVLRSLIRENYRDLPRFGKYCGAVPKKSADSFSSANCGREIISEKQGMGDPHPATYRPWYWNINKRPRFLSL